LSLEVIESEVLNELRRVMAVKKYSKWEISDGELMHIVGPEVALDIIQARQITEESIRRTINEYKAGLRR
jgi:hypothetical protein